MNAHRKQIIVNTACSSCCLFQSDGRLIVLRTAVINGNYLFSTKNSGMDTVKSPMGLFDGTADENGFVPNDLASVDASIFSYYQVSTTA